jgi:hypothetical protein
MHQSWMTGRQVARTDARFKISPTPGNDPIVGEAKSQSAKRNFQAGS